MNYLYKQYKEIIVPKMIKKYHYSSIMEVPNISKIVLNIGIKCSSHKYLKNIRDDLRLITGQLPIFTKAKKSISNFQLRKGVDTGCKVTLRKKNLWNFLEKLIYIVIPRIRDFRGIPVKSFDKFSNLNIGIKEYTVFPEVMYDTISNRSYGLNITLVTTSSKKKEVLYLLSSLSFPFK